MKKVRKKRMSKLVLMMVVSIAMLITTLVPAFATGDGPPTLDIQFDVSEMFTWAQTIINAMLPVLYIIMGVALGFLIIRAFKSAFN